MTEYLMLQQWLTKLGKKIEKVIMEQTQLQEKTYHRLRSLVNVRKHDYQQQIIPQGQHPSSIEFAQRLRQFNLLNQSPFVECVSSIQTLLKGIKRQCLHPQIPFEKIFERNITSQRISYERRLNNASCFFVEWPNITNTQVFQIQLPWGEKDGKNNKKLQISAQDLLNLKQKKMIPQKIIGNFFSILKQSQRLPQKTQIVDFSFLPFMIEGMDQDQERQEVIMQVVRRNYQRASKCLNALIYDKRFTVVPFIVNGQYSIVIIKGFNSTIAKKNQKFFFLHCSSSFTANKCIFSALKAYLQTEIEINSREKIKINDSNLYCTQLLLPKQTRSTDSGLFLMLYCEALLADGGKELQEVKPNYFGSKLHLFPLSLIQEMRAIIWNFYYKMINCKDKTRLLIIEEYFQQRKEYAKKADLQKDYATLDMMEVKKLQVLMNKTLGQSQQEKYPLCLQFYYHPSMNYYINS